MKKLLITFSILCISYSYAQVGIGTNTPDSSAMLEVESSNRGILFPRMTSTQRTAITSPATGLQVYDTNTNSLWYYNGNLWVNSKSEANEGDVKSGIQPNDHAGWVLLDGRAINSLSANQQAVATSLGLSGNLPNATNAYLVQNGGAMASVAGNNTTILTQANLPNVNFSGTAESAGGHAHTASASNAGGHNHNGTTSTTGSHTHSGTTNGAGSHSHSLNLPSQGHNSMKLNFEQTYPKGPSHPENAGTANFGNTSSVGNHSHGFTTNSSGSHNHNFTTSNVSDHTHAITVNSNGAHTHNVTVSSGGSATPINIAPRSLTVNMFIYLGL